MHKQGDHSFKNGVKNLASRIHKFICFTVWLLSERWAHDATLVTVIISPAFGLVDQRSHFHYNSVCHQAQNVRKIKADKWCSQAASPAPFLSVRSPTLEKKNEQTFVLLLTAEDRNVKRSSCCWDTGNKNTIYNLYKWRKKICKTILTMDL